MALFVILGLVAVGAIFAGLQAAGIIEGTVSVDRLSVGDCVMVPEDMEEVSQLATTKCDSPHGGEVFTLAEVPDDDDAPYPFLSLDETAADECLAAFEGYVGEDFFESDFDIVWLSPTLGSWDNGDRGITCIVTNLDGSPLTGSVADA